MSGGLVLLLPFAVGLGLLLAGVAVVASGLALRQHHTYLAEPTVLDQLICASGARGYLLDHRRRLPRNRSSTFCMFVEPHFLHTAEVVEEDLEP